LQSFGGAVGAFVVVALFVVAVVVLFVVVVVVVVVEVVVLFVVVVVGVVGCLVVVVAGGSVGSDVGTGGQGHVSKSGASSGPLTHPSQCSLLPHSTRR